MTEVLVTHKRNPNSMFRIPQEKYDEAKAAAEEAGEENPFSLCEEGCQGGPSYDQLSEKEKEKVDKEREERISAKEESGE